VLQALDHRGQPRLPTGGRSLDVEQLRQVTGVLMTQILPFADATVLKLLDDFETAVYQTASERASHG